MPTTRPASPLAALACVVVLGGCGGSGADPVAVVHSEPADGAREVGLEAAIVVTFDRPMEPASVEGAFAIAPAATGRFVWDEGQAIVAFAPSPRLAAVTTYTVDIGTGATGADGVHLGDAFAITFETFDNQRFAGADPDPVNDHLPPVALPEPDAGDIVAPDGVAYASRDLLVLFADGTSVAEANGLVADLDAEIAGALPEAGVVLLRRTLPTDLATLEGELHELQASPLVAAASVNAFFANQRLPLHHERTGTDPSDFNAWTWTATPLDGNWGLEAIRMPAAWNLTDLARRKAAGLTPRIAIIEAAKASAADASHEELVDRIDRLAFAETKPHATMVAGVIGAAWGNGKGIDGLHPLDPIIVSRGAGTFSNTYVPELLSDTQLVSSVVALLGDPRIRVINMSVGQEWARQQIDPVVDTLCSVCSDTHRKLMDDQGHYLLAAVRRFIDRGRTDFLVVCSAGNEPLRYGSTTLDAEARDNSPCTNLAGRIGDPTLPDAGRGADHFMAVEATDITVSRANSRPRSGPSPPRARTCS